MKLAKMAWAFAVSTVFGCATSFTGSAHIENGRAGCEAKCRGQGMQVAGMVYMGEYSSACVCQVPRGTASAGDDSTLLSSAAGGAGAAAGVIMQMARQQNQQSGMTFH